MKFDLEERTFQFAKEVRAFVKKLHRSISNQEDARQLVRSSGSIGANYIEANESLSKKDFIYRTKISRKESKESIYWLKLLDLGPTPDLETTRSALIDEAIHLMKIFGSIVTKSSF